MGLLISSGQSGTDSRAATTWREGGLVCLFLICLLPLVVGCGGDEPLAPVELPTPERVLAVAPSITEILFGLGLGDKVVAVGDYAAWPPEVFSKPRIGGLFDVRLEKIVELDPELVILLPGEEKFAAQMRELGVDVLVVQHESLDDVETSILTIAGRMDVDAAGIELAASFRDDLEPDPLPSAPPVMLTITRQAGNLGEVLVAGPNTFYDELLGKLGVVNAFGGTEISYPQVSAEGILQRRPHAIIELQPKTLSTIGESRLLGDWRQLPGLDAVKQDCLRVIAGDHVLLPGPRATLLYKELREALASCPVFSS